MKKSPIELPLTRALDLVVSAIIRFRLVGLYWCFLATAGVTLNAQISNPDTALANDPQNQEVFRTLLMGDIAIIDPLIIAVLTPGERTIYDQIRFEYPIDTTLTSPNAEFKNGKRIVTFGTSFYRAIMALGDLNMIDLAQHRESRIVAYMSYAMDSMVQNSFREPGEQLKIEWPTVWEGVDQTAYLEMWKNQDLKTTNAATIVGIVAFVFAHEIAHQVKNHVMTFPKSLKESREREQAADAWACGALVRAGIMPMGGIWGPIMFYCFDRAAIGHEELRTHPADIRRMKSAFDATYTSLESFRARFEANRMDFDSFKNGMHEVIQKVASEIQEEEESGQ